MAKLIKYILIAIFVFASPLLRADDFDIPWDFTDEFWEEAGLTLCWNDDDTDRLPDWIEIDLTMIESIKWSMEKLIIEFRK